jgi:hypothetical protein
MEYFNCLGIMITIQDVHMKVNPGFPWKKWHSAGKYSFRQKIGFKYKEESIKVLHLELSSVWCWNLDTSESRSEGWRISVGPIVWEIKKYYIGSKEKRNIIHTIKRRKANWIGHILHRNCPLKHVIERKVEGGI